jgi:formylglycine-generating enzyme required for sulfatase activity
MLAGIVGAMPAWSADSAPASWRDPVTGMEFVLVPGGCYAMGSATGHRDERPVHEVCIREFYVGKYEVTQGQWRQVMGVNPSRFGACGDACPVEQVSSTEAQAFADRLRQLTGKGYRLPTEAEWEYACRSGGKEQSWCGGDTLDALAWHAGNSGGKTHPVGLKQPNGLGLYDMSGNVWEWVNDLKGDYTLEPRQDPQGPKSGVTRVRRGGSWQYGAAQARSTWRSHGYLDDWALDIGFRLVLPVTE